MSGLGDLIAVDGSLIDATLSMVWADYRDGAKKAKVHLGFDIGRGIPQKMILTAGKVDERPQVEYLVAPGQTAVMGRYYQCYKNFDDWQAQERHFVCRLKASSRKTVLRATPVEPDSQVFFDATVFLGIKDVNQTEREVRLVGYSLNLVEQLRAPQLAQDPAQQQTIGGAGVKGLALMIQRRAVMVVAAASSRVELWLPAVSLPRKSTLTSCCSTWMRLSSSRLTRVWRTGSASGGKLSLRWSSRSSERSPEPSPVGREICPASCDFGL
ncbi:MAG: transposase [Trichloromonadaceae bacterium]